MGEEERAVRRGEDAAAGRVDAESTARIASAVVLALPDCRPAFSIDEGSRLLRIKLNDVAIVAPQHGLPPLLGIDQAVNRRFSEPDSQLIDEVKHTVIDEPELQEELILIAVD